MSSGLKRQDGETIRDVRPGLLSVPNNAPFRDHEISFTGHVPQM